jgi:hypothetical protein
VLHLIELKTISPLIALLPVSKLVDVCQRVKPNQVDKASNVASVQGGEFSTLYDRSDWPHWSDADRDCQNTRHEILIQTSTKPGEFKGTDNACNVLAGEWYDSYSRVTFTISKALGLAEMWFYGLCTDFSR